MNDGGLFSIQQENEYLQKYVWRSRNIPKYLSSFEDEVKTVEKFISGVEKLTKEEQDLVYETIFLLSVDTQLSAISTAKKEMLKNSGKFNICQLKWLKKFVSLTLREKDILSIIAGR